MSVIYKYLPFERLSYLENELLRITQPGDLNDPFECLPIPPSIEEFIEVLNITSKRELVRIEQFPKKERLEIKTKMNIKLKQEISKIRNNEPENFRMRFYNDGAKKINSLIGIISLSRRWNSTLMWSHYTNSHKGFCVGFNSEDNYFKAYNQLSNLERIFLPVVYSDQRVKIPIVEGEDINPLVMLTKSNDWEYEEEERLLVTLSQSEKTIQNKPFDVHLFKVPHRLITEIIVGANISPENLKTIKEFCIKNSINLYQSKISEHKFDMERFKI